MQKVEMGSLNPQRTLQPRKMCLSNLKLASVPGLTLLLGPSFLEAIFKLRTSSLWFSLSQCVAKLINIKIILNLPEKIWTPPLAET